MTRMFSLILSKQYILMSCIISFIVFLFLLTLNDFTKLLLSLCLQDGIYSNYPIGYYGKLIVKLIINLLLNLLTKNQYNLILNLFVLLLIIVYIYLIKSI